jgi:hypothetical protein
MAFNMQHLAQGSESPLWHKPKVPLSSQNLEAKSMQGSLDKT